MISGFVQDRETLPILNILTVNGTQKIRKPKQIKRIERAKVETPREYKGRSKFVEIRLKSGVKRRFQNCERDDKVSAPRMGDGDSRGWMCPSCYSGVTPVKDYGPQRGRRQLRVGWEYSGQGACRDSASGPACHVAPLLSLCAPSLDHCSDASHRRRVLLAPDVGCPAFFVPVLNVPGEVKVPILPNLFTVWSNFRLASRYLPKKFLIRLPPPTS
ncbi:hypothetical protein C8R44DRAFT_752775 [Mycena epipterygia]|nr:hypothetical protein C8R44DRAFT_752775 [Mycena epipterygia]